MGAIQRSTKHGLDYSADDYVVVSNGSSSELVDRSGNWGTNHYGAKIETAFTRYYKYSSDESGWEVTTKDGTTYFYGTSENSRLDCETGVFKWYLDKVEDTNGNYMTVEYVDKSVYNDGQVYLKKIEYTVNGSLDPSNYVEFHLESRSDELLSYASHGEVKTTQRLKSIEVRSYGDDLVRAYKLDYKTDYEPSVLEFVLQYGDDANIDGYGDITQGSDLPAIEMVCQETEDGFDSDSFLPGFQYGHSGLQNVFTQGDFNGDNRTDILYGRSDDYGRISSPVYVLLGDENGGFQTPVLFTSPLTYSRVISQGNFNDDGLTDLLVATTDNYGRITNQNAYVLTSNGDGTFSQDSYNLDSPPGGYEVISTGDYNGDGFTDFVTANTDKYNRIQSAAVTWNGLGSSLVYDMYPFVRYLSNGNSSFSRSIFVYNANNEIEFDPPTMPPWSAFWYASIHTVQSTADFNGDGKSDILLMSSDEYGRCTMDITPETPSGLLLWVAVDDDTIVSVSPDMGIKTTERVIAQGDFNGDGLNDLLVDKTDVYGRFSNTSLDDPQTIYINKGNGEDFESNEIHLTYCNDVTYGDFATYGVALKVISQGDFNGDGLSDFTVARSNDEGKIVNYPEYQFTFYATGDGLFRPSYTPYSGAGYGPRAHGDFNGDGKADFLLAKIDGDTGMLDPAEFIMLTAKPVIPDLLTTISENRGGSAEITYEPSSKYKYTSDINPRIPFILQTVSSITLKNSTEPGSLPYEYVTEFIYGDGKFDNEDRDFRGFRWAQKTNEDGTLEITYFKQEDYNKGRQYNVFFKDGGTLLNKTTFNWGEYAINGECKFVKLNSKYNYVYDGTTVVTKETYTYDNSNGNLLTIVSSDISTNPSGETLTTTKEYENKDTTGWVWRMTEESLTGSVSGTVRKTKYDYETYTGNLISKTFCLNIGAESGPTIDYDCDTYGNLIKETDPRNNYTETIYDTATQTYPVMIKYPKTDAGTVTHNIERSYDYKFGMPSGEKDENGNWTYYSFDAFGRVDQVDFPDGGQTITEYHDDVVPNYIVTKVKENSSSTIDSYVYVDGLGREKQTVTLGEDNKRIRTLNTYDDMGRIYEVAGPYFYGSSFAYSTSLPSNCPKTRTEYDQRGRPVVVESNDTEYGWNTTQFAYNGLSTTITDPDGKQKTEIKDYLGRLIQVIEYNGGSQYNTYYEYNAAGDLTQVKDHYNTLTTIAYDSLGRKTGMTDPDMGTWQYSSYDDNGNLLTQKSSRNIYTYFTYDELNRITQKSYSNGYTTTNYDYDNLSIPNGRGRLYSMSNYYATTIYNAYDEMGRVESLTKTITKDTARTTTYVYDESGKMMQMDTRTGSRRIMNIFREPACWKG